MHPSTTDRQVIKTGRKCTVCDHPELSRIDLLLADRTVSKRGIAAQFGLAPTCVQRHAQLHLPAKVKRAVTKAIGKADDVFMERVEYLWEESTNGLERAKTAARTVTDDEGKLVYVGQDLKPLAPLLGQCHKNLELLGNATGRFASAADVVRPVSVIVLQSGPVTMRVNPSMPEIDDENTIDVKAIS